MRENNKVALAVELSIYKWTNCYFPGNRMYSSGEKIFSRRFHIVFGFDWPGGFKVDDIHME